MARLIWIWYTCSMFTPPLRDHILTLISNRFISTVPRKEKSSQSLLPRWRILCIGSALMRALWSVSKIQAYPVGENFRELCEHNVCLNHNKIFPVKDRIKYPQPGRYVNHEQVSNYTGKISMSWGFSERVIDSNQILVDIKGWIVEAMKELRGRHELRSEPVVTPTGCDVQQSRIDFQFKVQMKVEYCTDNKISTYGVTWGLLASTVSKSYGPWCHSTGELYN